jgi:hypothetical protein
MSTQVMILGTFHMANPRRDVLNPSAVDILSERRQKEILDLVARLAKFRLTKIALEVDPGDPAIQQRFENYLAGKYTLTTNEVDQVGLRLAKSLHHRKLYGVDFDEDLGLDRAFRYAHEHPDNDVQRILSELQTKLKATMTHEFMESHSIREIFAEYNSSSRDEIGHGIYLALMRVGKGKEYPGTDAASHWYDRNLRMATHIARLPEGPGERILVIVGSGHGKLLRQFIREMPEFELVDCLKYLK